MLNGVSLVIGAAVKAYGTYGDPWVSLFSKFIMGIGLWVFQVSIVTLRVCLWSVVSQKLPDLEF